MHGDLAARNILIGGLEGGQENYVAKISDFGLSKTFYDDIRYKKQERDTVPWKWMDVEYLETGEFTLKSDVWSFGVVLWEILSMGQEPYVGKDIHNTIAEIKAGSRLPCPNQLEGIDWLEKFYHGATVWCWQADPNLRWSFESLVEYFETYLSEKELLEYKNFEEAYINMQDLINDDTTRLKRGPSYLKMSGAGEKNKASASSYSKASTVQIEIQPEVVQETGNGYHRFAGAQPGDGGLVANPSDNVPGGGYITPAQAGAGGLNSTQASPLRSLSPPSNVASANVSSYITMPQAMCQ
jgi:serine/threonine protein kinase